MALIDDVRKICRRLAPLGWRDLLMRITNDQLDITTSSLKAELTKKLPSIDRTHPGFADFAEDGERAVTARSPARSLLYHALASPLVVSDEMGNRLGGFPTQEELDTVENFVFGVETPTISDLLSETGESELSIVVFAFQYRPAGGTCSRRRADLVFSRTGVSRVGTAEPEYNGMLRGFWPEDATNPRSIRVTPCRYAAYLAVQSTGNESEFVPLRFQDDQQNKSDADRSFWIPVHKLFDGSECVKGLNLNVTLSARHYNDKIRRVHLSLDPTGPAPPTVPPYQFFDGIAEFSTLPGFGSGTLVPTPHPRLVEPAIDANGAPVSFRVPPNNGSGFASYEVSSEGFPAYVHARTRVDNGTFHDVNDVPDVRGKVSDGDYDALNYIDFTGDGEVEAACPQLESQPRINSEKRTAFSLVAAPDFFPSAGQRELTEWTTSKSVPAQLRNSIWGVRPAPLSDVRLPANLQFPNHSFDPEEDTISSLVPLWDTLPTNAPILTQDVARASWLPDDAAGIFAPGWAVSTDSINVGQQRVQHLASYGLGSPFPEDAKLCAALSTFWPAVAPDTARSVSPHTGNTAFLGTVSPLTDEEIGQVGTLPWDGVPGPVVVTSGGQTFAECPSFLHVDYVHSALNNLFSLRLTARIDTEEYQQRVLAMALTYQALGGGGNISGVRNALYLLSFRRVSSGDTELQQALQETSTVMGTDVFRVDMCVAAQVQDQPSPTDHRVRHLPIVGRRLVFTDPENGRVLHKLEGQPAWSRILG